MGEAKKTPIGEMRIVAPGVILHRLDEGISVTEDDAAQVKRATEELAEGKPVAIIVDMRAIAFAGRDARDAFQEGAGGVEIGTALLAGMGFSEKLAGLFKRYSEPSRPVEIFHREAEAIAWAEALLAEQA
jgi:hypothetical protein